MPGNRVLSSQPLQSLPAVLALELAADSPLPTPMLDREQAETLAARVAEDLHTLLPGVDAARLAVVGAHFDAVELLRPGFPLYATLDELAHRLPRQTEGAGVVAFGAHQGRMAAEPLTPDPQYAGGPMRLLPWTLLAAPEAAAALGAQMEVELVGRGEAGARTADFLMRTLGARFEHARYLTRQDLLAMTCVQYEHANLAALWTLIEAALLTPYRAEDAVSARGVPLHYADGAVSIPAPSAWLARQALDGDERAHALAGMLFELRQSAALLGAHRVALRADGGDTTTLPGALLEEIAAADPRRSAARLFAHQAPGLGTVAVTVAQNDAPQAHVLAHAYPLAGGLRPLCAALAQRYGTDPDPQPLGRVQLDAAGRLDAPAGHALQ